MRVVAFHLILLALLPAAGFGTGSQPPPAAPCPRCDRSNLWTNVYLGAEGGFNWIVASDIDGYTPSVDMGYCAGGVLGYQFPQGAAFELEVAYRNNSVDYVDFFGLLISANQPIWNISYLWNVLYELPYWCWKPFAGVGIGYSTEHAKVTEFDLPTDQDFDNFTYQVLVGFDYNVWRGLDVGIEYKFLSVPASNLDNHALMADIKWYW